MKKFILLISILALTLGLFAAEVVIGDGTSTQRFPLGAFYGYERSAALYTATEIGAQNTRISAVSWYSSIATTADVPTKIYMKTTSASTLTTDTWGNMIAGAVLLYDQTLTGLAAGDWNLFTLNNTFDVDQGDNLMILVERNFGGGGASAAGGSSGGGGIYSTSFPGTHLTWNADQNPPTGTGSTAANRPNVTINYSTYTIDTAPNPAVLNSPANEAINVSTGATLNWGSGGGAPTGYKLFFGTDNPPTNIASNTDLGNVFTYDPASLNRGATYYWQIVPYNANGSATGCPIWSFSTVPEGLAMIGDGTATNLNLPINPYYGYNYSQTLYLQNEIDISGQRIERLFYHWNGLAAGNECKDWTIYMGHTAQTEFTSTSDWVPFAGLTQVFDGEIGLSAEDGWIEIVLTMPFVYNNTDNLVIAVHETTPGNAGNSGKFFGTGTTDYRGLRIQNDSTNPNPESPVTGTRVYGIANIRMQFGDLPTAPLLSVSPEAWDFGSKYINTVTPKQFSLTNTGSGTLDVSSISVTGEGFALAEAFTAVSLASGVSANFTVNFAPLTAGALTGNVVINDNRSVTNVPLSGFCVDPIVYDIPWHEGFETDNTNNTAVFGWTQEEVAGTYEWTANDSETSYNREPKSGDWNAYLRYGNTRWMFKPVQLQAGTVYRATVWARQNTAIAANATLTISYGSEASAAGMTETILAATGLVDGEYQRLGGTFTPATSGIHYLGILATITTAPWYVSIDDISIDFPEPVAPEPATVSWPLDESTALINPILKWNPSVAGEPASSYKVYLNEGGAFTEADVVYEGADTHYQTTDLSYGQLYHWQVLPINAFGSDPTCPVWTFNTPTNTQIAEGFESTTFPPVGWENGSAGNWTRSTSTPKFEGDASAYKFTSTSNVYVLSTPMLDLIGTSTLDFYSRATNTSQILQIVYSADRETWTQVGADVTYAATGIWYHSSIDLSSLAGSSYYFGFQTPVQTTTGSVYVDHVVGPEITPNLPGVPTLTAPVNAAVNQSIVPELTWTAANTGGVPAGYNVYLDTVDGSTLFGTSAETSYIPATPLNWNTTYYWKVTANNNAGESAPSEVFSFTTMADITVHTLPFTEGFEANNTHNTAIFGWTQEGTTGTNEWTANNTETSYNRIPRTGDWNTYLRYGSARWMFKPVQFEAGTAYRVSLYARQDGSGDTNATVGISYGADPSAAGMTNTILAPTGIVDGDYQRLEGVFTPTTSGVQFVGIFGEINFSPWYISIDDIMIEIMSTEPVFVITPDAHDFGDLNPGQSSSKNFTITNNGGGSLGINAISIAGSPTMTLGDLPTFPAAVAGGETVTFSVTYAPTALGEDTATVTITDNQNNRQVIGNGLRSAADNRDAHTVLLTGTGVSDITIGDGSGTARVPADFYWRSSLFETIYTADEMGNFIGAIEGVKFYNQFTSNITATPLKIWLGTTAQTSLDDGWIPSTGLTQVFNGVMDFPAGQNVITIDFPQPYMHLAAGNLVMLVSRPLDTDYYSSSDYFKTQTIGTNRSREMHSDTVEYDPAAPTGGTVNGIFPKTTFMVVSSGIGQITGTVHGPGNSPLADVQVNVNSRPYSTTTNAQGQFSIDNVLSGDYAVTFTLEGYVTQTVNIVLEADETEVMNVTMAVLPPVNVTGTVLAGDTGSGLAGASIELVGDEDYSGTSAANGTFTIANVMINQSYAYTITAAGYETASGTIAVATEDFSMGNITLAEIPLAPFGVVATESANFQSVNVSWLEPAVGGDSFEDDFESYANFAMQFGDWTTIDVDGSGTYGLTNTTWLNIYEPMAYMVFNPSATVPPVATAEPHSGDKYAASFAATTPPNNDSLSILYL